MVIFKLFQRLFFVFIFSSPLQLLSSGYDIYIPPPNGGQLRSVAETKDGGFIVCGNILAPDTTEDLYFARYDSTGNLVWSKQLNDTQFVYHYGLAKQIVQDSSGEFIFIGTLDYSIAIIGRLDSVGNLISRNCFSGDISASCDEIRKTNDNAYIVTYHDYEGAGFGWEGVFKMDNQLNTIWHKMVGYGMRVPHGLAIGPDNSIYLFLDDCGMCSIGYIFSPTDHGLDAYGNDLWNFRYGMLGQGIFNYNMYNAISGTYNHGMLKCGLNNETINQDVSISYIDSTGDSLWTKRIGSNLDEQAFDIKILPDSGYIITGYMSDSCFTSEKACMLLRLDKNADSLWTRSLPGPEGSTGKTIQLTNSGDFLIFCTTSQGYRVIKTDTAGNIYPSYSISANSACASYCTGDTATLTINPPASAYLWSTGDTTQSIQLTNSGMYSAVVTDSNGITYNCFYNVNFLPNAIVTFANDTVETCISYLAQSVGGNNSAYNYQWYKNDTLIVSSNDSTYLITQTGTYKLVVSGPCDIDSATFFCIIHQIPISPVILINPSRYFCYGDSVQLYTSYSGFQHSWYRDLNPNDSIIGLDSSIYVSQSGMYFLEISDSFGCSTTSQLYQLISMLPNTAHIYNYPSFACYGDSMLIGVNNYYANYLWNTGDTTYQINVTQPGSYYCIMNVNTSCQSYSDTISPYLPWPQPNLGNDTVVCTNSPLILSAGPPPGPPFYLWNDGSTSSSYSVYTGISDTLLIYCQIITYLCTASDTIQVIVDNCLFTDEFSNPIDAWPVPVSDKLNIGIDIKIKAVEIWTVEGKFCQQYSIDESKNQIDLSNLQSGLYFLRIITPKKTFTLKIPKL